MIIAKIKSNTAFDVANFLERMIPTHVHIQETANWQEVANALYALANDTDAIVSDDDDDIISLLTKISR